MTSIQIVEEIMGHFPNLGSTEILVNFNQVYKDFCAKSRIYKGRWILNATSNPPLTESVVYPFPEYVGQIYRIDMFNEANKDVPLFERPQYLIEHREIRFYGKDGEPIDKFPINKIKTIRINYIRIPTNIDLETNTELAIDSKWVDTIIAGTLKKLYSKYPVPIAIENGTIMGKDWNAVKHFTNEYLRGIADAKAESNRDDDITAWDVELVNFT